MGTSRQVKKIIHQIVEKLENNYKPQKILLFGSYAYGDPTEDSDLDLLIIKDTDKSPIDRWLEVKKILRDPERRIPVSALVYTEQEIEARKAIKDFFIAEIFKKGKLLYG
jgi:predicted nucleotidyltransferase